jgi:hypothetical protein
MACSELSELWQCSQSHRRHRAPCSSTALNVPSQNAVPRCRGTRRAGRPSVKLLVAERGPWVNHCPQVTTDSFLGGSWRSPSRQQPLHAVQRHPPRPGATCPTAQRAAQRRVGAPSLCCVQKAARGAGAESPHAVSVIRSSWCSRVDVGCVLELLPFRDHGARVSVARRRGRPCLIHVPRRGSARLQEGAAHGRAQVCLAHHDRALLAQAAEATWSHGQQRDVERGCIATPRPQPGTRRR